MEKIIYNDDNLILEEINDWQYATYAIMVDSKGEILICKCGNQYSFPGIDIDSERYLSPGLEVGIRETTGIDINVKNVKPFLVVQRSFKQKANSNQEASSVSIDVNSLRQSYYHIIYSEEEVEPERMIITKEEKEKGFSVLRVSPNALVDLLKQSVVDDAGTLSSIDELLEIMKVFRTTTIKTMSNCISKNMVDKISKRTEIPFETLMDMDFTDINAYLSKLGKERLSFSEECIIAAGRINYQLARDLDSLERKPNKEGTLIVRLKRWFNKAE